MDGEERMTGESLPPSELFTHDAMNTTFSLRIYGPENPSARDMARECFDQLDYLESRLSRFIEGSDIFQINHLREGETLYLSEPTHQCLLAALDAHQRTGGLFDITLGSRISHRKAGAEGEIPPLIGRLTIHPDVPAVTCESPGREIDLGGIGKGFALDQLKQLLLDWDAEGALLAAGASSFLAFGPESWPIELTGNAESARVSLTNRSLSASGTGIQGSHILHPGGETAMPSNACQRVWVTAPTATLAEIWSTAVMLVPPDSIAEFTAGEDTIGQVFIERSGMIERVR
jgi:thiamine biosynthesis lipoprotein